MGTERRSHAEERRRFLAESRQLHSELTDAVKRDTFLMDWLTSAEKSEQKLYAKSLSASELQSLAERYGCRTVRGWNEMRRHALVTMHQFVHEEAFKNLWAILRKADQESQFGRFAYSPAHGAVPARLLDAVYCWHQSPKFTRAERRAHSKAVASACKRLEELLVQVTPGDPLDDQFARFRFTDPRQARALFTAFVSNVEEDRRDFPNVAWNASHRLLSCGIDPLWAVRNVRQLALTVEPHSALPRKLRTKSAKRTYFIRAVRGAIELAQMGEEIRVGAQAIADVVALLANMDCSLDDVRKAQALRPEA